MAGWTEAFKESFIREMKQKKENGEKFTEQDAEWASYFKLSLEGIDNWEDKESERMERFKEYYIDYIKQKMKNGEQITEGDMKTLESFKISLEQGNKGA